MHSAREQEELDLIHTSRVLRSARKLRGITQSEASDQLQISQSMISKLEKGLLSPSASLWFSATKLYNIPVTDSFESGYIDTLDHQNILDYSETSFKIPEEFLNDARFSVRSISPLLNYFVKKKGEKFSRTFFKSLKIDTDYFYVLDAKVNSSFLIAVLDVLQKSAPLNQEQIQQMVAEDVSNSAIHGNLRHLYNRAKNSRELLKIFLENSSYYETNYHYSFKDISPNKINVYLTEFESLDYSTRLNSFLYAYKDEFFKNLTTYKNAKGIKSIKKSISNNKGASTCTFEIILAE